jgi:hypothetical protein
MLIKRGEKIMKLKIFNVPVTIFEDNIVSKFSLGRKHIDKYYYVIDKLYTDWLINKQYSSHSNLNKILSRKKFIPLHAKYLANVLTPQHYKIVLTDLINDGVIEPNNQYIPGKKSRSYRLKERYSNCSYRRIKCTDTKFSEKLHKLKETSLSQLHKNIESNLHNFNLDFEKASVQLEFKYKSNQITDQQYTHRKLSLEGIYDFNNYTVSNYTVSQKTGRAFHHYSNLKKELRSYITYDLKGKLTEVDVKNSQPLFLSPLLIKENSIKKLDFYGYVCTLSSHYCLDPYETEKYISLTTNGRLYNYLSNASNLDREKVKKNLMPFLFGPTYYQSKIIQIFRYEFPTITRFINEIKKGDHSKLAILLQNLEANYILEIAAPKLLERKIPFIPIHDSFLVPEEFAYEVKKILVDTFYEKYKLPITIDFKKYGDQSSGGLLK